MIALGWLHLVVIFVCLYLVGWVYLVGGIVPQGGWSWEKHWNSNETLEKIGSRAWDVVVLQVIMRNISMMMMMMVMMMMMMIMMTLATMARDQEI